MKTIESWHFASGTLCDGQPLPRKGQTLRHAGPVLPCESGYHASERAIDALQYAPGTMVARVRLGGRVIPIGYPIDQYAASERTTLTDYVDAHDVLVALARRWALRALRVHLSKVLRAVGLDNKAAALEQLPDDCDLEAAASYTSYAAYATHAAASAAASADASYAARAAAQSALDAASITSRADADAETQLQNRELEHELYKLFN